MFEADSEIISLGKMAVFYLPAKKLKEHPDVQTQLEHTLISEYQGWTKHTEHIVGGYQQGSATVTDDHVRYEVSFAGKDRVAPFVAMLKQVCRDLEEVSIYLTMGEQSFLVQPKSEGAKDV